MGLKEWLIKKLESSVEPDAGYIDLQKLSEEDREKKFIEFGEGNQNLTNFLRIAYNPIIENLKEINGFYTYVCLRLKRERNGIKYVTNYRNICRK